jgi:hypothetical protein
MRGGARCETFYADRNRSGNVMHIETDGCVVEIHVGLTDDRGRQVTRVDVMPDNDRFAGTTWYGQHGDRSVPGGWQIDAVPVRVVKVKGD